MVVVRKLVAVLRKEKSEKVVEEVDGGKYPTVSKSRCQMAPPHLFYSVIQDHMLCISTWISTMFRMHGTALT